MPNSSYSYTKQINPEIVFNDINVNIGSSPIDFQYNKSNFNIIITFDFVLTSGQTTTLNNTITNHIYSISDDLLFNTISATTISGDTFISGNTNLITIIPKIYSGITTQSSIKIWTASATTSSGVATFNVTTDGTSSGTSIFNTIFSITPTAFLNTSTAINVPLSSVKSISSDKKVITTNTIVGTTIILLGGNTVEFCPNGTIVFITIIGS